MSASTLIHQQILEPTKRAKVRPLAATQREEIVVPLCRNYLWSEKGRAKLQTILEGTAKTMASKARTVVHVSKVLQYTDMADRRGYLKIEFWHDGPVAQL